LNGDGDNHEEEGDNYVTTEIMAMARIKLLNGDGNSSNNVNLGNGK
jgi:hypothetical protein